MGRVCKVCDRDDRPDIEIWLLGGDSLRSIGERTGLSKDALSRHRRDHSPIWLARVTETQTDPSVATVRQRIETLINELQAVIADAKAARRHTVILQAARELRAALETIGRITG